MRVQYTYVRAQSILRLAQEKGIKVSTKVDGIEVAEVEKMLQKFPEIIEEAQNRFAPNYICTYLIDLAHSFNAYCAKNKIIGDEGSSSYRVALTEAVAITIKNGLNLLGISVPEKM